MRELKEAARLASRYSLIRRLGRGGMAEVWLAKDDRAGTLVALKFLNADQIGNQTSIDLFHKEWTIGSRLMHAHIGRVFEYHDEPDGPFYSLQYINGPDIGVLANESLQDALPPFGMLADALRYAHGKGLVHRDIKAGNVLLDERGVPHLIDFGVAATAGSMTASGGGAAIAASPGQQAGNPPQAADDIFSLGVLMHEIVTGSPPELDDADRPMRRPDGQNVATAVQNLVRKMLSPAAELRPSAESVIEQLEVAGFPAGPARTLAKPVGGGVETDALQPGIQSIRPQLRAAAGTARSVVSESDKKGLRPNVVLAGLGILLLLFIGVIFVLPKAVDNGDRVVPAGPVRDVAPKESEQTADDGNAEIMAVERETGSDGSAAGFGENLGRTSTDEVARIKIATDEALGDLLSQLERLKYRGIERWGGQPYLDVLDIYAEGDAAYLAKNYGTAGDRYREATKLLDPFYEQIDAEFEKSLTAAKAAFAARDFIEAIRLYDLAVAITPGHREAEQGLKRAISLEAVLKLMDQGSQYEENLELEAAKLVYEKALQLDSAWQPASDALVRIRKAIEQAAFDARMSEGLDALATQDFETARAAFNAAKLMYPASPEPVDGLLQVDQEIRLASIRTMEAEAAEQESGEQWETAVTTYQALLDVDADLQFAQEGLSRARARAKVHRMLNDFIADPDALNDPVTMQKATRMLLDVSRMQPMGPRLEDQKKKLSILLKRAATPLPVRILSDNLTEVSVYKVGKLGRFDVQDLSLRPGVYVAVGIRPGYRDVRLEFRVSPDIESKPIVVKCEEAI
ncbi:MAG: serine/threonine protein kinase [Gammaproteobacteria bacterium]|nr:serine/threonine protein kinase [Gammaproteobacteria bacterium]